MSKKILLIIALVAIAVFALFTFRPAYKSVDPRPVVRIGLTLPLTGNLAQTAQVAKAALLMAQSEIPEDSKFRYELVIEDDQSEARKVALNINRLTSVRRVDALLSMFASAATIGAPIAERGKIPNISCTWGAEFYKQYEYSFNHWPRPDTQAKAFFELLKDNSVKSIAVVVVNWATAKEVMDSVEKYAETYGVAITSINWINSGAADFRIEIERIRRQNPDAVMLMAFDPEMTIFVRQAHAAGLRTRYVSIDQFLGMQDKQALDGAVFIMANPGDGNFEANLAKRTNIPNDSCAANLYDAFKLLVSVYESYDRKLTGTEVKERLYQIRDFQSALGVRISVDEDGIIDSPPVRARIENGQVIRK